LEEISLASLPAGPDSEVPSESSHDDASEADATNSQAELRLARVLHDGAPLPDFNTSGPGKDHKAGPVKLGTGEEAGQDMAIEGRLVETWLTVDKAAQHKPPAVWEYALDDSKDNANRLEIDMAHWLRGLKKTGDPIAQRVEELLTSLRETKAQLKNGMIDEEEATERIVGIARIVLDFARERARSRPDTKQNMSSSEEHRALGPMTEPAVEGLGESQIAPELDEMTGRVIERIAAGVGLSYNDKSSGPATAANATSRQSDIPVDGAVSGQAPFKDTFLGPVEWQAALVEISDQATARARMRVEEGLAMEVIEEELRQAIGQRSQEASQRIFGTASLDEPSRPWQRATVDDLSKERIRLVRMIRDHAMEAAALSKRKSTTGITHSESRVSQEEGPTSKFKPTPGDAVLVGYLDEGRNPEIAARAGVAGIAPDVSDDEEYAGLQSASGTVPPAQEPPDDFITPPHKGYQNIPSLRDQRIFHSKTGKGPFGSVSPMDIMQPNSFTSEYITPCLNSSSEPLKAAPVS
jgi:hypothetical protein